MAQLGFDEAGMCCAEVDQTATSIATVVTEEVAVIGASLVRLKGEEATEFPPGWFCPRRTYHDVRFGDTTIKLRVDIYDWHVAGNRLWWDAKGVLPFLGYPTDDRNTSRLVLNSWERWTVVGNAFWDIVYLMRKAASPKSRSKDQGPFRMSDVHVLSSHGLLLLQAWRLSRHDAADRLPPPLLQKFLNKYVTTADLEFNIDTNDVTTCSWPGVPPRGQARVVIDEGQVWLQPILIGCNGPHAAALQAFLRTLASRCSSDSKVPADMFLAEFFRQPGWDFILKQVVTGMCYIMERDFAADSGNPLQGSASIHGLDLPLRDHLVLGRGTASSDRPATFPSQHLRSFQLLCKDRVSVSSGRQPNISFATGRRSIMHRYLSVGRRLLADCQVLSVTCDATRLGGRELFAIALGGRTAGGEYLTVWAPPQVLGPTADIVARKSVLENPRKGFHFKAKSPDL